MLKFLKIISTQTIAQRTKALFSLQQELDKITDTAFKQRRFETPSREKQRMLDELYGQLYSNRGSKNIPTLGGRWTGEAGDSVWIPDNQIVPPDRLVGGDYECHTVA